MKLALAAVLIAATAAPALAADAAPAAKPAYSTGETSIGALLDNPATRAVLDKDLPGFADNPQIEMARGFTLKQVQAFAPDKLTDELLAKVDADLAQLPAAK